MRTGSQCLPWGIVWLHWALCLHLGPAAYELYDWANYLARRLSFLSVKKEIIIINIILNVETLLRIFPWSPQVSASYIRSNISCLLSSHLEQNNHSISSSLAIPVMRICTFQVPTGQEEGGRLGQAHVLHGVPQWLPTPETVIQDKWYLPLSRQWQSRYGLMFLCFNKVQGKFEPNTKISLGSFTERSQGTLTSREKEKRKTMNLISFLT